MKPESVSTEVRQSTIRRVIGGAAVGNLVEWFDWSLYGYLAATLGVVFFPSGNPTASLLSAFAVFAAAFVMRPLGGLIAGALGDRFGRRDVLAWVISLMAAATVCVALLPSYAAIGLAAPILLVFLRLLQGLSAGGEFGGAVSFVAEYSPPKRRGFMISWLDCAGMLANLCSLVLVTLLTYLLSRDDMVSWGWRVPFLVALPLGVIGLYLRLRLEDTPVFRALHEKEGVARAPLRMALTEHWRALLLCSEVLVMKAVGVYGCIVYMPTYMSRNLGLSNSSSFVPTVVGLLALVILTPLMGALSDRIGRKPVLIAACGGFVVLSYPAFLLMSVSLPAAISAEIVLMVLLSGVFGPSAATMTEVFPTRMRYSGGALSYNVTVAAFGGTAPFIATYLVATTGNSLAPAFYVITAGIVGLIASLRLTEWAGRPLLQGEDSSRVESAVKEA